MKKSTEDREKISKESVRFILLTELTGTAALTASGALVSIEKEQLARQMPQICIPA